MAIRITSPTRHAFTYCVLMLATVVVLSIGVRAVAEQPRLTPDELMDLLAQRQHRHATFTERQYFAILERPLQSSGELFYDAPGRLEKRTLQPKPESLILDNGVMTVRRGRRSYDLPLHEYPQFAALIESVLATLAGDRATLERTFTLAFDSQDTGWTIALVPRESAVSKVVQRIQITGNADSVREVEVHRTDGDRSVMTISELAGTDAPPLR